MTNICRLSVVLFMLSCGGSMTKEQRDEMKEARDAQRIQRITESELLSEALERGRKISALIPERHPDESRLDSIAKVENVTIRFVRAGSDNALEIEKQLIEAYIVSSLTDGMPDNVQKVGDSLLYTKPVIEKLPEGIIQVNGMYSIMFSVKDIVLSIDE